MAKFIFVVLTTPHEGQDDAYNEWYDNQHIPDLLAIDGFTGATRYELAPTDPAQTALPPYMALYEVEAESVDEINQRLGGAIKAGKMPVSDAMNSEKTIMAFYTPR